MSKINVNIIRAYTGPLHSRLEAIWDRFANEHSDQVNLWVYENTKTDWRHADMLKRIWCTEQRRPEDVAVITEFDFLPDLGFLTETHARSPIEAATYCTRSPATKAISTYGRPGPWFMRFNKPRLVEYFASGRPPGGLEKLNGAFSDGGTPPDPCGRFFKTCPGVHLLGTKDCYPDHYGVRVGDKGEHLFWSRHYNDPPEMRVAGFALGDILKAVEERITRYEKEAAADRNGPGSPKTLATATDSAPNTRDLA